jgi:hypothetical protein
MFEPILNDGEAYVDGRSEETAKHLYELAEKAGVDQALVSTTSHGYIVPAKILGKKDEHVVAEDQPAVSTEPGTTTDAEEAVNADVVYNPAEHSVAEVKEYLDGADEAERQRVLDAEASSEKPRKGLLKEGDK